MSALLIRSVEDIERNLRQVREAAAHLQAWFSRQNGDPIELIKRMKFECIGLHPIDNRPLNLLEQANQSCTFIVALAATQLLLDLHPDAGGYRLAPGAHASLPLDIMSESEGLVGAETFAAVDPRNNQRLIKDLTKMAGRSEQHRYVFFMSPKFPGTQRREELESSVAGVQVWSVD